jgi:hypothetical protein
MKPLSVASIAWLVLPAALAAQQPRPTAPPNMKTLLARTAEYADQFETSFVSVIGREVYDQAASDSTLGPESRRLDSEVFFVGLDRRREWLTVRNVTAVDGSPVRDSSTRLDRALAGDPDRAWMRLRILADENARFNVGAIQRNFSEPTLVLMFSDSLHQRRFKFTLNARTERDGRRLNRLEFRETERPTIIRDADTRTSLPASGALVVDDQGSVVETELSVPFAKEGVAAIHVWFERDDKLGMLVPVRMDERYEVRAVPRQVVVTGTARYSDYRRFETSVRILPP